MSQLRRTGRFLTAVKLGFAGSGAGGERDIMYKMAAGGTAILVRNEDHLIIRSGSVAHSFRLRRRHRGLHRFGRKQESESGENKSKRLID